MVKTLYSFPIQRHTAYLPIKPPGEPVRTSAGQIVIAFLQISTTPVIQFLTTASRLFQLDMVITSILILCVIAMGLYQVIQGVEKFYRKRL